MNNPEKTEHVIITEIPDLEMMDYIYGKFETICSTYKAVKGDDFEYDIDPNYDDLTITVTMEFQYEEDFDDIIKIEDDNTEGDSESD